MPHELHRAVVDHATVPPDRVVLDAQHVATVDANHCALYVPCKFLIICGCCSRRCIVYYGDTQLDVDQAVSAAPVPPHHVFQHATDVLDTIRQDKQQCIAVSVSLYSITCVCCTTPSVILLWRIMLHKESTLGLLVLVSVKRGVQYLHFLRGMNAASWSKYHV